MISFINFVKNLNKDFTNTIRTNTILGGVDLGWIVRVIITVLMFITNFIIIIMIRQLSSSSLSWSLRSFIMIIMIIMVMFMMVITITSSSSMKRRSLFGSSWWLPSAFWLSSSSSSWWRYLLSDICDSADFFKKPLRAGEWLVWPAIDLKSAD